MEVLEPVQRRRGNRIISNFSLWRSGFPVALFPACAFFDAGVHATLRNRRRSRNIFFSSFIFFCPPLFLFPPPRPTSTVEAFRGVSRAPHRCGFASSKYNSSRVARVYCARINSTRQTIRANERHERSLALGFRYRQ